jgi:ABC-type hemin transport system ATPase subunit
MALVRLTIQRFTAFEDARFEFSPGVNAFIGVNGTGKSHLLKLVYVLHEAARQYWSIPEGSGGEAVEVILKRLLMQTFRPDAIGRLVRRTSKGQKTALVEAVWREQGEETNLVFSLTHRGGLKADCATEPPVSRPAIFLPTREVLSFFKGFVALWDQYDLEFDRTYRDICQLLALPPLRGARTVEQSALLEPLEEALGGTASIKNGRFYVRLADGDMEAALVAEGLRKLAMLSYLVLNGSLKSRSMLLWDEPEASVNPALAPLLAATALALAAQGIQVVLATHDYVFASELSLRIERASDGRGDGTSHAFFGLQRAGEGRREVERAGLFTGLQTNPILDALAALHDRELAPADAVE